MFFLPSDLLSVPPGFESGMTFDIDKVTKTSNSNETTTSTTAGSDIPELGALRTLKLSDIMLADDDLIFDAVEEDEDEPKTNDDSDEVMPLIVTPRNGLLLTPVRCGFGSACAKVWQNF